MPGSAHCIMRLATCATRDRGMAQSHASPHAKIPGEQLHAQAVLFLYLRVSLSRVCFLRTGSRLSLSQVGDQLPAFPLSFLERGLQWFSGPPGLWYRVCATRSESVCTPVAPPLEPSLCSQLPTPPWWRSRSPALPPPARCCRVMHYTVHTHALHAVPCVCRHMPRM